MSGPEVQEVGWEGRQASGEDPVCFSSLPAFLLPRWHPLGVGGSLDSFVRAAECAWDISLRLSDVQLTCWSPHMVCGQGLCPPSLVEVFTARLVLIFLGIALVAASKA